VLAIGIAATTSMFSIVSAVLLQAEPWPDAERLVRVFGVRPQERANRALADTWNRGGISWAAWRDLQAHPAFADVAVWVPNQQIVGDEQPELVGSFFASSSLPRILNVGPLHGRFFNADEDEADSGAVILSHRLWLRMFGGDPDAVGRMTTITLPGAVTTGTARRRIVGILPAEFVFPGAEPDVLLPIGYHKYNGSFGNPFLYAIARISPAVSISAAADAAEPLVRRDGPPDRFTSRIVTLRRDRVGLGDQSLWLMLGGAGLLLLVACANVSGLLLSDARSRQHESAVRLSLGGSRLTILRQLMSEHAVLAVAAAGGGVLLAKWTVPVLVALAPAGLVGDQQIELDARIAGWSMLAAFITTMAAGLLPAIAASRSTPNEALKRGAREVTRATRWRHRLVVTAQFSLALVLLIGAGLFAETLLRLANARLGFEPESSAVFAVTRARSEPTVLTAEQREARRQLAQQDLRRLTEELVVQHWVQRQSLLDAIDALPDVRLVAAADAVPFTSTPPRNFRVYADGQTPEDAILVSQYQISTGYFEAMGIAVREGRTHDHSVSPLGTRLPPSGVPAPMPLVISETVAARLLGNKRIGQLLRANEKVSYEVIGVVGDVRQRGVLDDEAAAVYLPFGNPDHVRQLVVRTFGQAAAAIPTIRSTIERHSPPMFVTSAAPLRQLVDASIVVERSRARLSGVYGLTALLLAAVGLYGLAARMVAERRREIGIRVALGAGRSDIRRLVMTDAWIIVGVGLLVGLPTGVALARVAQSALHGVAPAAPRVFAIASLTLVVAAIVATMVPAIRANRVDPATTLREE
jgi:predicted permease